MTEQWLKIKRYPVYEVSNRGQVRRIGKIRYLKGDRNRCHYRRVKLYDGHNNYKRQFIHILVAIHFIHRIADCVVDHIDGDKENNNVNNLQWICQKANCRKRGIQKEEERENF